MAAGRDGTPTNHTIAGTDGARTPREVGRRALDALGPHVEAVQRLADAAGAREATERSVTVARKRAAELVRRARADAADLLQTAAAERRDARVAYRDVFPRCSTSPPPPTSSASAEPLPTNSSAPTPGPPGLPSGQTHPRPDSSPAGAPRYRTTTCRGHRRRCWSGGQVKGHTFKRCPRGTVTDPAGRVISCRRKHGSWFFAHDGPPGDDGQRRQVKVDGFPTEREAHEAMRESMAGFDRGQRQLPTWLKVDDYLDEWLAGKGGLRRQGHQPPVHRHAAARSSDRRSARPDPAATARRTGARPRGPRAVARDAAAGQRDAAVGSEGRGEAKAARREPWAPRRT